MGNRICLENDDIIKEIQRVRKANKGGVPDVVHAAVVFANCPEEKRKAFKQYIAGCDSTQFAQFIMKMDEKMFKHREGAPKRAVIATAGSLIKTGANRAFLASLKEKLKGNIAFQYCILPGGLLAQIKGTIPLWRRYVQPDILGLFDGSFDFTEAVLNSKAKVDKETLTDAVKTMQDYLCPLFYDNLFELCNIEANGGGGTPAHGHPHAAHEGGTAPAYSNTHGDCAAPAHVHSQAAHGDCDAAAAAESCAAAPAVVDPSDVDAMEINIPIPPPPDAPVSGPDDSDEVLRLQRENDQLRMEIETLRKTCNDQRATIQDRDDTIEDLQGKYNVLIPLLENPDVAVQNLDTDTDIDISVFQHHAAPGAAANTSLSLRGPASTENLAAMRARISYIKASAQKLRQVNAAKIDELHHQAAEERTASKLRHDAVTSAHAQAMAKLTGENRRLLDDKTLADSQHTMKTDKLAAQIVALLAASTEDKLQIDSLRAELAVAHRDEAAAQHALVNAATTHVDAAAWNRSSTASSDCDSAGSGGSDSDGADIASASQHGEGEQITHANAVLLTACRDGDLDLADLAIQSLNASVEAHGSTGLSALATAVDALHCALAMRLVAVHGANPSSVSMSDTEVCNGANSATVDGSRRHLVASRKADIITAVQLACGPFHQLCAAGETGSVQTALAADAGLAITRNRFGATPFHAACVGGHIDVAQLLIKAGAIVGAVKEPARSHSGARAVVWLDGASSLHFCVMLGQMRVEMVRFLIDEAGVDVNAHRVARGDAGMTPLQLACSRGDLGMVRCLVDRGHADINQSNADGATPLHAASRYGHLSVVRYLALDVRVAVNAKGTPPISTSASYAGVDDEVPSTAVIAARESARAHTPADIPLRHSIDGTPGIDRVLRSTGETAVHIACRHGHLDVVVFLTSNAAAAANVNIPCRAGATPLQTAVDAGHRTIAHHLVSLPTCTAKGITPDLGIALGREHTLFTTDSVPANSPRLFLCGGSSVGKTMLASALPKSRPYIAEKMQSVTTESTAGFAVSQFNSANVGSVSLWDLSGHSSYRGAQELCIRTGGPSAFLITFSFGDSPTKQMTDAMYWAEVIVASAPPHSAIMLAGSHRDSPHAEAGTCKQDRGQKRWRSVSGDKVLSEVQRRFGHRTKVWPRLFCLDCRSSRGTEMEELRVALGELRIGLVAASTSMPRMCVELAACIQNLRSGQASKDVIVPVSEVTAALQLQTNRLALTHDETVGLLRHSSEVIFFPDRPDVVVINPHRFGTELIGLLFAPTSTPHKGGGDAQSAVGAGIRRDNIAAALKTTDAQRVSVVVDLLQHLGLCYPLERDVFMFPAMLSPSRHPMARMRSGQDSIGRRLQRRVVEPPLPARFFPHLQTAIKKKHRLRMQPWAGGALVSSVNGGAHGWMDLSNDRRYLDIVVVVTGDDDDACEALLQCLVTAAHTLHTEVCDAAHFIDTPLNSPTTKAHGTLQTAAQRALVNGTISTSALVHTN
jgi:ankyrin repeat protein